MAIPETARTRILADLDRIERDENVRILFAVESGSRAWGFPSPDSDYDARFVYARPADWYLSLEPGRDVIELSIDGDFDVNGWDIRKALQLLLKPNPFCWNGCRVRSAIAGTTRFVRGCRNSPVVRPTQKPASITITASPGGWGASISKATSG